MRNGPSDFGRDPNGLWAIHGRLEVDSRSDGDLRARYVRRDDRGSVVNEFAPRQSEEILDVWAIIESERIRQANHRGRVPLPTPTFEEYVAEISTRDVEIKQVIAWCRQVDARWDEYDARRDSGS